LGITATDNCFASPVVFQSPAAGTVVTDPTTINITAIDDQGNAKEVLDNNGMPILLFTPDQTISDRHAYAEWLEPDSSLPFESVTPLVDRVMYDKLKASQISYS
jgi:hypothetical protein